MLPVIVETGDETPLPTDFDARRLADLTPLLPIYIRQTDTSQWKATGSDIPMAASHVFDEEEGHPSVYRVGSMAEILAVGAYLAAGRADPFKRPVYVFALDEALIQRRGVMIVKSDAETECFVLNELHYDAIIPESAKVSLFQDIQQAGDFNYRIHKAGLRNMTTSLHASGCLEHSAGPCIIDECVEAIRLKDS